VAVRLVDNLKPYRREIIRELLPDRRGDGHGDPGFG
jgi:hypothetical protein